MAGEARKAAERIAQRIQDETFDQGSYEISWNSPERWLQETTKILTEEISKTIEQCAQIADKFDKESSCSECTDTAKIAAAIRSIAQQESSDSK